ncbi:MULTISPECIES: hypothetical protein [Paenibacillus]|uniref:hypothetical protein n=1 Tax=Paenibacillus TaxID=44249 RepID=UPI00096CEABF|nr:hypothetical protein [Paenibacillus odorifer]OMD01356.1 hypothetical protein BJP46_01165 [Paenibacillus odorifer]OME50596.1 hypothetical protein BSK59_22055 [Paenibacillus odorifer]OME57962.1 hypothetical protein BSK61_09010 [Paenibacillus odorifer]
MLDFILFMIFSILETYAMFFLAFKIFKIDLYHKEMVFASFIMGFFSYTLRINYGIASLDTFSQYALMFCFMWMLFRIHPFYASILTGMAYQSYSVIQTTLFYLLKFIFKLPLTLLDYFSGNVFVLQFLTALTVICIGMYVGHKRLGFDFVPDKPDVKIKTTPSEKILFTLNLPALFIITSFSYFIKSFYFFLIPIFYGVILWGYLYLSYKKDRNNYESFSS